MLQTSSAIAPNQQSDLEQQLQTKPVTATIDGASKRFGQIPALDNLHLSLVEGSITVLLGPNGAGKTTATRLLTGAVSPDSGSVTVFGRDPAGGEGRAVRANCGVVSAKPSLYDRLSGEENLRYAARLYGMAINNKTDLRIKQAAAQFGIIDDLQQRVGGYSTGMKTRLALARAVLHDPQLMLLDEPTSGLDPESSSAVLSMVREMTDQGRTVMMCTHLLIEAEGLADQIVVIDHGTDLLQGTHADLAARYWPNPAVKFRTEYGPELDQLAKRPEVSHYERSRSSATVWLNNEKDVSNLIYWLVNSGVRLISVEPFNPSLEDVYLAVRSEFKDWKPDQ